MIGEVTVKITGTSKAELDDVLNKLQSILNIQEDDITSITKEITEYPLRTKNDRRYNIFMTAGLNVDELVKENK